MQCDVALEDENVSVTATGEVCDTDDLDDLYSELVASSSLFLKRVWVKWLPHTRLGEQARCRIQRVIGGGSRLRRSYRQHSMLHSMT